MHFDHLIIGGGVAGTTAAETIRSRATDATVAIVGAEPHLLYSRVLLPHVIRGKSTEQKAFLRTSAQYDEKGITLLNGRAVVGIDGRHRVARMDDGSEITFGKLLIATGGTPRQLECPGGHDESVLSFQTIEDARKILAASHGSAVTVGGGFIALEFIMSFAHLGAPVTAILRGDGFFSRVLDKASSRMLATHMEGNGVTLVRRAEVKAIERRGLSRAVHLSTGVEINTEAVGVGVGLVPNIAFLKGSGVETAQGVIVDSRLRASVDGVYAAGDVAEFADELTGERRMVGNWTNALLQGKFAGMQMTGSDEPFRAVTSYAITCFGLSVMFLGATDLMPESRIVRESDGSTVQFFIRRGAVVAATCVGPFSERAIAMKMIERRFVPDAKASIALADPHVPLSSFLP